MDDEGDGDCPLMVRDDHSALSLALPRDSPGTLGRIDDGDKFNEGLREGTTGRLRARQGDSWGQLRGQDQRTNEEDQPISCHRLSRRTGLPLPLPTTVRVRMMII